MFGFKACVFRIAVRFFLRTLVYLMSSRYSIWFLILKIASELVYNSHNANLEILSMPFPLASHYLAFELNSGFSNMFLEPRGPNS